VKDGLPPLGNADVWAWDTATNKVVNTNLVDNKIIFPLELNTMPGYGSSFYWMRYMDAQNENEIASKEALIIGKVWIYTLEETNMQLDIYCILVLE
jgi:leucyl-tRNA synthetase